MVCAYSTNGYLDCFGASYRVKPYYGSVDGCYVIINLLFVHSHPSTVLTQIVSNLGEDKRNGVVRGVAGAGTPGPQLGGL